MHEVGLSPFRYNDAEKALWAKFWWVCGTTLNSCTFLCNRAVFNAAAKKSVARKTGDICIRKYEK